MKILSIEIHNVASIVDATIDFASGPLADERIFLISGETGTGKTTILNSICLALYNSTPALLTYGSNDKDANGQTTRNSAQMLRRGTREGWINLEFEGNDGVKYRAVWTARKIKKRDKSLKIEVKTRIERAADGEIVDIPISELTGLTFKQFTQTTLLAQGQFTRFLLSDDSEKAEILEKLTGTEIYASIGQRIYETLRQKESALKTLNDRIDGAKLLAPDQRDELTAELLPLRDAIAKCDREMTAIDAKLKWLNDGASIARRLAANKAERDKADADVHSEASLKRAETVRVWEETAMVRRLIDEAAETETELKDARDSRPALRRRYAAILGAVNWLNAEKTRRKAALDAIAAKVVDNDVEAINQAATALRNQSMALGIALSAIERYQSAKSQRERADEATKAVENGITASRAEIARLSAEIPPLESDYRLKRAHLDGMKELKDHITSLRRAFEDSHECPLCGSKGVDLATDALIDEKLSVAQADTDAAKSAHDTAAASLAKAKATLDAKVDDLKRKQRELKIALDAETKAGEAAREAGAAVDVDCDDSAYAPAIKQRIADVSKALEAKEQTLRDALALRSATESLAAIEARIVEAERSLSPLTASFDATAPVESADMPDLIAKISALIAATSSLDGRIASLSARLTDKRALIAQYMDAEGSCTAEQINAVSRLTMAQINAAKAQIKAVADKLVAATAAVDEVERQSAEHQASKPEMADDDTIESLTAEREQTNGERDRASKRQAAVETLLDDDERRAKDLAKTKGERDALKIECADWEMLESLYGGAKGQKFRLMAQCFVLRTLLHKANHYLAMLSPRYELYCADNSLVINVIDRDQANAIRPVNLLSGGESFIVSLALALGLSAISKERLDVDTLFIDEGFGTLDAATLETVLTTLDRLHTLGGRRVGIISHVAGLAERIPAQIRLRRIAPAASAIDIVTL